MKLVFLGPLADLAGGSDATLPAPTPLDWQQLLSLIAREKGKALADMLLSDRVLVAINGRIVSDKAALSAAEVDEVAFLPPVSGG